MPFALSFLPAWNSGAMLDVEQPSCDHKIKTWGQKLYAKMEVQKDRRCRASSHSLPSNSLVHKKKKLIMFSVICCRVQSWIKMVPFMLIWIKDPGDRISFANLCGTLNILKVGCLCNEKMHVFTSLFRASYWHFIYLFFHWHLKSGNIWSFKIILSMFELIFQLYWNSLTVIWLHGNFT